MLMNFNTIFLSVNSGTMLLLGRMLTVTWKWGVTVGCLMHLAWRI
jgi:hypothetical protein